MPTQHPSDKPAGHAPDPRLGRRYGKYLIIQRLGEGGMGIVYEAEDTLLKRRVAIKFLPDEMLGAAKLTERFLREAQVLARVQHPNISAIYDVVSEPQHCYMAMELLLPVSAGSYLKGKGAIPWSDATRILADCCAGLAAAHAADVIHRDIKPHNILFCPRTGCAKLVDFGLGKGIHRGDEQLTLAGELVGTPLYMSPEQATNKPMDARSDVYSLGTTYYALLTGGPPFTGDSLAQVLTQHCVEPMPDPRERVSDIPESCIRILMRATSKSPAERYSSAKELLIDLEQALSGQPRRDFRELIGHPPGQSAASVGDVQTAVREASKQIVIERSEPSPNSTSASVNGAPTRRRALGLAVALGGTAALGGLGWLVSSTQRARENSAKLPSGPARTAASGPGAAPVAPTAPAGQTAGKGAAVRIGVLMSLGDTLSSRERPIRDAVLLAVGELNARGGVLGRPIEVLEREANFNDAHPNSFRAQTERLLSQDSAVAVFGGYTTASRKAIKTAVEPADGLLFCPSRHEGLEESPNIIYTGAVPNQVVMPAVRHCVTKLGAKRVFLIGSDTFTCRVLSLIVRDELNSLGAHVVEEHFPLLRELRFGAITRQIVQTRPALVISSLAGDANVAFLRDLRKEGITSAKVPMLSVNLGEDELGELADVDLSGDYLAAAYLQAVPRPENQAFLARFRKAYGEGCQISDAMEAAYASVHLWAAAAQTAHAVEPPRVRAALRNLSSEGPGATLRIDPSNNHAWKMFRIGQMGPGNAVQLIASAEQLVQPIPFPPPRTRLEWSSITKRMLDDWGGSYINRKLPGEGRAPDGSSRAP